MAGSTTTKLSVCKAFYFFFFSSYMLRVNYSPVYFKQLGLPPSFVGIISGTSPFIRALGGLFLCYLADKANLRKIVFLFSLLACVVTPFLTTLPKPSKQICPKMIQDSMVLMANLNAGAKINAHLPNTNETNVHNTLEFDQTQKERNLRGNLEISGQSVIKKNNVKKTKSSGDASVKKLVVLTLPSESPPLTSSKKQEFTSRRGAKVVDMQEFVKYIIWVFELYDYYRNEYQSNDEPKAQDLDTKENLHKRVMEDYRIENFETQIKKTRVTTNNTDHEDDKSDPQELQSQQLKNVFALLLVITIIGDFLGGPAKNLADTATVLALQDDKSEYGKVRLWSNFGQLVIIPSVSVLVYFKKTMICDKLQDEYKLSLYILSAVMVIALIIGTKFKFVSPEEYDDAETEAIKTRELLQDVKNLVQETWSLLIIALFMGAFEGVFSTFMFWYITNMKTTQATLIMGVANFLRNLFALFTFLVSPCIIRRIGAVNSVNLAIIFYGLAFLTYALIPNPWLAVIPEVIQSTSFALTMSSFVSFFAETTSIKIAATAQGLLQFMYMGAGQSLGPVVGGYIIEHAGASLTFLVFAVLACFVLLFSMSVQLVSKYMASKEDTEPEYQPVATEEKFQNFFQGLNERKTGRP